MNYDSKRCGNCTHWECFNNREKEPICHKLNIEVEEDFYCDHFDPQPWCKEIKLVPVRLTESGEEKKQELIKKLEENGLEDWISTAVDQRIRDAAPMSWYFQTTLVIIDGVTQDFTFDDFQWKDLNQLV